MPGVAETFKSVIKKMPYGPDIKMVNLFHPDNANITHEDLNTSIAKAKNWWNFYLVLYDTLPSRAKPSNNGQLSYCAGCFAIFDESHQY